MKDANGKELRTGDVVVIRAKIAVIHTNYLDVVTLPMKGDGDVWVVHPGEVEFLSREEEGANPLTGSLDGLNQPKAQG